MSHHFVFTFMLTYNRAVMDDLAGLVGPWRAIGAE
jgi:hypothetical protein